MIESGLSIYQIIPLFTYEVNIKSVFINQVHAVLGSAVVLRPNPPQHLLITTFILVSFLLVPALAAVRVGSWLTRTNDNDRFRRLLSGSVVPSVARFVSPLLGKRVITMQTGVHIGLTTLPHLIGHTPTLRTFCVFAHVISFWMIP